MKEEWKDVKGYEGRYQISNYGNVASINYNHTNTRKILKSTITTHGYYCVDLYANKKHHWTHVHRLVAKEFVKNPNPDKYYVVNHKDENKKNNVWTNLEWCTMEHNTNWGTRNERASKALSRTVFQFDDDGVLINTWESFSKASKETGIAQSSITRCCQGKLKHAGKFVWKYHK